MTHVDASSSNKCAFLGINASLISSTKKLHAYNDITLKCLTMADGKRIEKYLEKQQAINYVVVQDTFDLADYSYHWESYLL